MRRTYPNANHQRCRAPHPPLASKPTAQRTPHQAAVPAAGPLWVRQRQQARILIVVGCVQARHALGPAAMGRAMAAGAASRWSVPTQTANSCRPVPTVTPVAAGCQHQQAPANATAQPAGAEQRLEAATGSSAPANTAGRRCAGRLASGASGGLGGAAGTGLLRLGAGNRLHSLHQANLRKARLVGGCRWSWRQGRRLSLGSAPPPPPRDPPTALMDMASHPTCWVASSWAASQRMAVPTALTDARLALELQSTLGHGCRGVAGAAGQRSTSGETARLNQAARCGGAQQAGPPSFASS